MYIFKGKLFTESISDEASFLIKIVQGRSSHCESSRRNWGSSCAGRQIDLIKGPLPKVLHFLKYFFYGGYEFKIITGFQSVNSAAYHDAIERFAVWQDPRISALSPGIFNKIPQQTKLNFIWHVRKVLNLFISIDCDKNCSLKDLTSTLTMLLELISAAIASEIY